MKSHDEPADFQRHLTAEELGVRWGGKSPHAIHIMRNKGTAPPAMKINGRLLFSIADIEAYERAHRTLNTSRAS